MDGKFDPEPAEKAEERSKGRNWKEKLKIAEKGGAEANKGEKIEDKLETANSVENEIESEEFDSIRMFD